MLQLPPLTVKVKVVQIVSHFNYLIDINKDQNLLISHSTCNFKKNKGDEI